MIVVVLPEPATAWIKRGVRGSVQASNTAVWYSDHLRVGPKVASIGVSRREMGEVMVIGLHS